MWAEIWGDEAEMADEGAMRCGHCLSKSHYFGRVRDYWQHVRDVRHVLWEYTSTGSHQIWGYYNNSECWRYTPDKDRDRKGQVNYESDEIDDTVIQELRTDAEVWWMRVSRAGLFQLERITDDLSGFSGAA